MKTTLTLLPLECRLAPATLVNPTTVTYQDVDGDIATVKLSKPVLRADNVGTVFTFSTGGFDDNNTPQLLETLDLTSLAVKGAIVTVSAKAANGTPSKADVGFINADGIDLRSVTVAGDLGSIGAGDDNLRTAGLGSLTVGSLGVLGATPGNDLNTLIHGALNTLTIKGDLRNAAVRVRGNLTTATIGGSMVATVLTDNAASIVVEGSIKTIKITGDVAGNNGVQSGAIIADGTVAEVTKIKSRRDPYDGGIYRYPVTVGYKLLGGSIGSATIGGGLQGGAGVQSGSIGALTGSIKTVSITGNVTGSTGNLSGSIFAQSDTLTIEIGDENSSAEVPIKLGGNIGVVSIRGSLAGGGGIQSGSIVADQGGIVAVKIGGDLTGGSGEESGSINATGSTKPSVRYRRWSRTIREYGYSYTQHYSETKVIGFKLITKGIGSVMVAGKMAGGGGTRSGTIASELGSIGVVTIRGDLEGGSGQESGAIMARSGAETIGEDVERTLNFGGSIAAVTIGGSLLGGSGISSGTITTEIGSIGAVSIRGNMTGGTADTTGMILATGVAVPKTKIKVTRGEYGEVYRETVVVGYKLLGGMVGVVNIGGHLQGNSGGMSGSIGSALGSIGSVHIKGNVEGGVGNSSGFIFANVDVQQTSADRSIALGGTIGAINVGGSVTAGTGFNTAVFQGQRSIGAVNVGKDWNSGSVIAGRDIGPDNTIDTADDDISAGFLPMSVLKIGSIVIRGQIGGTAPPTTGAFRFIAPTIGSLKVKNKSVALKRGSANDVIDLTSLVKLVEFEIISA